jgi:L-fuconolactonase
MTIDTHHHFWRYNVEEYGWISARTPCVRDEMSVLRRSFGPEDLKAEIRAAGIDGVVSVQARQKVEETEWLLELAAQHDFLKGVVGWVPLVSPDVKAELERLAQQPKLKGVRHVLQDEEDDLYMLRPDFNAGLAQLKAFGLAYDLLIFERHLPQAIELVDRHPEQVFVVDHAAKPRVKDNVLSPWDENLAELAERENVYCKLSGLVTEADFHAWTKDQLKPYMEVALEAFGPDRLMFGSDWPVCLVACGYGRWHEIVSRFVSGLSDAEQERILGSNAVEVYRL